MQALANGERVAVYGDYDVDGVTATALLVQVLRGLGGQVEAYIPDRFEEGYGLNNAALHCWQKPVSGGGDGGLRHPLAG